MCSTSPSLQSSKLISFAEIGEEEEDEGEYEVNENGDDVHGVYEDAMEGGKSHYCLKFLFSVNGKMVMEAKCYAYS